MEGYYSSEGEFETTDAGADAVKYKEAGRCKEGSLILMKGQYPCKIADFKTLKNGKHGAAKALIIGYDLFTNKRVEEQYGAHDQVSTPLISYTEYTCIDINGEGILSLLTANGELKQDVCADSREHKLAILKCIEEGEKECIVKVLKWE